MRCREPQGVEMSPRVQASEGSERNAVSLSPVVNITVTGSPAVDRTSSVEIDVAGDEGLRRRGQRTEEVEPNVRQRDEGSFDVVFDSLASNNMAGAGRGKGERRPQSRIAAGPRTLSPCGLDPGRRIPGRASEEAPRATAVTRTLEPCGLGLRRPEPARMPEEASVTTTTTNPRTLGKHRGRRRPCGLGPSRAKTSGAVPSETGSLQGVPRVVHARWPVDRFRRPWGTKQKIILSCGADAIQPLVYLTQNGDGLHSGICRPMQCAGTPIQRSLCRLCFQAGQLPSRKVEGSDADRCVYFTRSGHYVHRSSDGVCLDSLEETIVRKLCRCCRWGG